MSYIIFEHSPHGRIVLSAYSTYTDALAAYTETLSTGLPTDVFTLVAYEGEIATELHCDTGTLSVELDWSV